MNRLINENADGHFGQMGGAYVPETLIPALEELKIAWREIQKDEAFWSQYHALLRDYVGRPTPLYFAKNLSENLGHAKIYLKREDLCHTGAHKINNALGQALLAKRMGKKRIIAETGAGQHGVATATACALLGLTCEIFMGEEDIRRQTPNVERMKILGAQLRAVDTGSKTLKDAMNEALRDWVTNVRSTYYLIGSVAGPHPYPSLVRDFQRIIGQEVRWQVQEKEGRKPDLLVACVGGGSNAMGLFAEFLPDSEVRLLGVEAAGQGLATHHHSATLNCGKVGVLHGSRSYLLQNDDGQVLEAHSIAPGLDYPGVGPELSYLKESGRLEIAAVTDAEALQAFSWLSQKEGIIPALESSHALAQLSKMAKTLAKGAIVVVNLSGRGDKDLTTVSQIASQKRVRR